MTKAERLHELNRYLLAEMPQFQEQAACCREDEKAQWMLFRSLVNMRSPKPASESFLKMQDAFLQEEGKAKGITNLAKLEPAQKNLYLWRGDITTLKVDGIVNAANSGMTGCYHPCHGCIDNAIHTFAGVQLRLACADLMERQGHPEPAGQAKITGAYNLSSTYILHTVGPIVSGEVTGEDCRLLSSCYRSCLKLADEKGLKSLAFCCISTGEFHFPNELAAEIAVDTVNDFRKAHPDMKVVFNVFREEDLQIYRRKLGGRCDE